MELNLAFMSAGEGANIKAILDEIRRGWLDADPKVIIGTKADSPVSKISEDYRIPFLYLNEDICRDLSDSLVTAFRYHGVNLVVLDEYNKLISREVVRAFRNRIVNMHSSLLPEYGNFSRRDVCEEVLESGEEYTGSSVHIVTEELCNGKVLGGSKVRVVPGDTIDTLEYRVKNEERGLYNLVLLEIQSGIMDLDAI